MFRNATFRSATSADLDAILAVESSDLVPLVSASRFRQDLALHRYRLEWTWVAEDDRRITAFALWWGIPDSAYPLSLDCVWVAPDAPDPAALAAGLLKAALDRVRGDVSQSAPDLNLDLPSDWRDEPRAREGVAWRRRACESVGLTDWNERRQQEWTTAQPVPRSSDRLSFSAADDNAFLDAFRRVAVGSLDVLTRRTLAELGAEGQAQDDLDFYLSLPGDRQLWRLARNASGELVGLVIPSRSAYDASVSYLGVTPEQRGRGHVDDLLAEITRIHAAAGATRITGTTDSTNAPMLAAFARAGYLTTGARLVGSQPASTS